MGFQLFNVTGEAGGLPQLFIVFAFADKVLEEREAEGESVPVGKHSGPGRTASPSALLCPLMADLGEHWSSFTVR